MDRTEVAPRSSVTRRRTMCEPPDAKGRDAAGPWPSSKKPSSSRSHCWDLMGPSGSVELDRNETWSPTIGAVGEKLKLALGFWLGTTLTVLDTGVCTFAASVTVRVTLCGPAVVKICLADAPVPSLTPSASVSHARASGAGVVWSVNCTASPTRGVAGVQPKLGPTAPAGVTPAPAP